MKKDLLRRAAALAMVCSLTVGMAAASSYDAELEEEEDEGSEGAAFVSLSAKSSGYIIPTRTLRPSYKGDDVYSVQERLMELDYTVNLTGTYDAVTVAAVKSFQKRNGLTVDGLAGTKTYAILYSDVAVPA